MEPPLVRKCDPEDRIPEAIRCDHGVRLLRLGRVEGPECVTPITILEQGILYRSAVDSTQERSTEHSRDTHHVERVESPVVESLEEQYEAEKAKAFGGLRRIALAISNCLNMNPTSPRDP